MDRAEQLRRLPLAHAVALRIVAYQFNWIGPRTLAAFKYLVEAWRAAGDQPR
jgi:hypothetical protein